MKTCTRCGEQLPLANFSKHAAASDGLSWWCKKCQSENWASRNHKYRKTARLQADMKWQGVLRYLLDRGEPATTREIAQALKWNEQAVRNVIVRKREIFVAAGEIKPLKKVGRGEYLWAAWEE